jgi:hypothetical protein
MVRRYDFTTCSIYRYSEDEVRGSMVQSTTLVYENIPCSFWATSKNFWGSQLSVQSNWNTHEMNLDPIYDVFKWDIVTLQNENYKVTDVIPHPDRHNVINNLQVFLQPSKND